MIIRRMHLVNFRKYADLELEFPEGLIGIVGPNGAGKTTLLEAIGFALYGVSASRSKGKGVRRDHCAGNETCIVELDFALGGNSYRIVRELRGANEQQTAKMFQGDQELIAHQARGIEAKVRQLLGLDYQTFIRSIFARQKELALLSDERPEERRRAIRRMMGIERIERAYTLAREDQRAKEDFIRGALTAVADLEIKSDEFAKLQPQIETERTQLVEAEKAVDAGKKSEQATRQALAAQEEKREKFTELDKKLETTQAHLTGASRDEQNLTEDLQQAKQSRERVRQLQPQLATFAKSRKEKERLDQAQGVFKERTALADEIENFVSDIAQSQTEFGTKQNELKQFAGLARQLKKTAGAIQSAEKQRKAKDRALKQAQSALDQTLGLVKQLADNVKRVRQEGTQGDCPTCLRPLGKNYDEIIAHFTEEKSALTRTQSEWQTKVDRLEKELSAAEKELRARSKEQKQLLRQVGDQKAVQADLKAIRKALRSDQATVRQKQKRQVVLNKTTYDPEMHRQVSAELKALSRIHEQAIELRRDASRIPTIQKDLAQTKTRLAALRQEIKNSEVALRAIAYDATEYEQAKLDHDHTVLYLQELEAQASRVRADLGILHDRSTRLDAEIKQKIQIKNQIQAEEEAIRYLAQLEYVLKEFQGDLISRIRPLIAQRASILLDQVTEGRYPQIELDEDYTIGIVDEGVSYPIKRYSGGEEDLINLCLRIAISQIIAEQMSGAGSGLIALDEVFGSQDRERRERLIRAMHNLTPFFRQILFITHIEDLQERVPNLLQVAEKSDRTAIAQWLN